MSIFLAIVALLGAGLGGLMLSQATMGVGFIAGACLVAIFARMVQADEHKKETLRAMHEHFGALHRLAASRPASTPSLPITVDGTWICWPCGRMNRPMVAECTTCGAQRPAGGH